MQKIQKITQSHEKLSLSIWLVKLRYFGDNCSGQTNRQEYTKPNFFLGSIAA